VPFHPDDSSQPVSILASGRGSAAHSVGRNRAGAVRRGATSVLVLGLVMMTTAAVWGMVRPQGAPSQPVTTIALAPAPEPPQTTSSVQSPTPAPSAATTATAATAATAVTAAAGTQLAAMGEMEEGEEVAPAPASTLVTAADRGAGLRTLEVMSTGKKKLVVVPGNVKAPGKGRVYRVRVEVESGLDVDGTVFAGFVMATLNDGRSWGHGGTMTFARTAGRADIRVVLASPTTSAAMCRPLITKGTLSCANGSTAVLTVYRWIRGTADYGKDITGYRQYLVNHEVGHVLGHGHQACPGKGTRAPVMLQQTKGLKGCTKNPWPFP
jgi:hypothetical protein